jgi:hypothetical protein
LNRSAHGSEVQVVDILLDRTLVKLGRIEVLVHIHDLNVGSMGILDYILSAIALLICVRVVVSAGVNSHGRVVGVNAGPLA